MRMERNAAIMERPAPPPATLAAIGDFPSVPVVNAALSAREPEVHDMTPSRSSWLALGPFLLLAGWGLVRWRQDTSAKVSNRPLRPMT
ncbi:MAG: hypothetical protein KZQ88_08770 [Candidatus Thiodiazotropha sp. (ex Dulcina madagascariensis)]|nr:hypothetical protein [Candidatus Thiodiazotropha sp. (ex Dulcina madagascariensis)]MCU7928182.1 hypothetical protein [Candidatus Thiodiazotropha sp. (ex Dulcina madagascariensis)]